MELGRNREKIGEVHDKVRAVGKEGVPPLLLLIRENKDTIYRVSFCTPMLYERNKHGAYY